MTDRNKVFQAIQQGRFETTAEGLMVPSENTLVQGVVSYAKRGEPEEVTHNLIVGQGLTYLLAAAIGEVTPITSWYVAIFSGDVTVQGSWTAANFSANATEVTDYEGGTRLSWENGDVAAGAADSFSNKASFEASVDGVTVRGAALISNATKGGTTGTLIGATRFPTTKNLDTGEILDVGYGLQLSAIT